MIIITAKQDGFRRGGITHSAEPTKYADDHFSEETLEAFEAEPMLVVSRAEDDGTIMQTRAPDDMTVAELKTLLERLDVDWPPNAKKADLIALVMEHTAEPPDED